MSDIVESILRLQLASIEVRWRQEAEPVLAKLASLEAMLPPKPLYLHASQVDAAMLSMLGQHQANPADKTEKYGDRMARIEDDRRALLHLVRMMYSATEGGKPMPAWLATQIETILRSMKP